MDANPVRIEGYTVLRVAGRGGMGVVYEAERSDGRRVALKVIAPELGESDELARRFAREARLAAEVDHPHVVPVIEAGVTEDGRPFLAFAYIDGTDLDKRVRERGRLAPREAARIIAEVAGALDAAHARGLVHRDVKPANVLLDRTDTAYLSDFGLTRPVSGTRFTRSGAWMGTVDYAAPEQIQGLPVDARSDIYSLAAMAYHLLSGAVPFPRDSDMAKLWAHVNDARPELPDTVEHRVVLGPVISRGMSRSPDERFLSAGDFAAALLAAADGQTARIDDHLVATGEAAPSRATTVAVPAGEAPTIAIAEAAKGRRRTWTVVGIAGVLIIAAAVAGIALLRPAGDDDSPRAEATETSAPTPSATVTPSPTVTTTATPSPRPTPVASPKRSNDLPLALDAETNVPSQVGSWSPSENPTIGAAQKAFGTDYAVSTDDATPELCTFEWPNLGITVDFVNLGGEDACGIDTGLAQNIQIDGAVSDRWRTLSGLRPGMRESAIPKLYRRARKTDGGDWWLVTAKSLIGGGSYYAPIAAKIEDGRVSGFDLVVGAAGD